MEVVDSLVKTTLGEIEKVLSTRTVVGEPVTIQGVTLIPVASTSLNYWRSNRGISFWGIKQPFRVVVVSPSGKRAFRISGEEVSLDELIQEVPGIRDILAEM